MVAALYDSVLVVLDAFVYFLECFSVGLCFQPV